jgi:glycyl-tRNA synthetase
MNKSPDAQRMEKIVSLCKRRGFIFQSSEIYGGLNGSWDYGPLGVELKRNLKDYWWRTMVHERDDVVGMDGSILMNRAVWKASGHEDTFSDPMVDCLATGSRFRTDQIRSQSGKVYRYLGAVSLETLELLRNDLRRDEARHSESYWQYLEKAERFWSDAFKEDFSKQEIVLPYDERDSAEQRLRLLALALIERQRVFPAGAPPDNPLSWDPFEVLVQVEKDDSRKRSRTARAFYERRGIDNPIVLLGSSRDVENSTRYNPENGGLLTEPRPFNLMFKTHVGATADESSVTYLRPETAQAIFVQFKNVLDTSRKKLPFGIAQIGKAFRNEINPRNFTFRSREFEQMELEYFCRPEEGMKLLEYWRDERLKFYESIGISRDNLHLLTVPDEERAFYSKGTYDIEYDFPFGKQELEGVAYRTDYDLTQHQKASGKSLEYFDEETKQKFIPHVVEPSAGVDRTVLALICEAYTEDEAPDEKGKMETRTVLRFHPRMAPIKCAIFPLLKNKEELVAKAKEIVDLLRPHMHVFYDESGAIGRRYRRQDEIGTPFGVTVDFDTLGEKGDELRDTVTLRERDTMKQERVKISDLPGILISKIR